MGVELTTTEKVCQNKHVNENQTFKENKMATKYCIEEDEFIITDEFDAETLKLMAELGI